MEESFLATVVFSYDLTKLVHPFQAFCHLGKCVCLWQFTLELLLLKQKQGVGFIIHV